MSEDTIEPAPESTSQELSDAALATSEVKAEAPSAEVVSEPESTPASAAEPSPATGPPLPPAAWGTAAPARSRRGLWIAIVALVVVFVIALVGGGGAYVANASLSQTYSPQRALLNYFAAQQRGDVNAMWSSATYLRGDAAYEQFFSKNALTAMMSLPQNRDIAGLTINSTRTVDSKTATVSASMTWGGQTHSYDYTLHKDTSASHYFFYNSWKIDIPYGTINMSLPNQSGDITIDDMSMPVGYSGQPVATISGFHTVRMAQTPFYDAVTERIDAIDIAPTVSFPVKISDAARAAAAAAIKAVENNCDAGRYTDCPGHTYHSGGAAYTTYYLTGLPGYSEIDYNYYVFNYSGDITTGMTLDIPKERDLMYANGTCTEIMTVDGSRTYRFSGDWGANLTWSNNAFKADFFPDCVKNKA